MAEYLMPSNVLKLEEQREIFKIRARTNKLPSNWGKETLCETGCSEILNNENETFDINCLQNGSIEEKLKILNIFKRSMKRRKMYLPQDSEYHII